MHILCPICSDLINQADNIYVTKCGHMFHHHCLAQWIERSRTCPQCRNKVTETCMYRLYPTISNEASADDAATLQSRLDDAMLQLRQNKAKFTDKENELKEITDKLKKIKDQLKDSKSKQVSQESLISNQNELIKYLKVQNEETNKLKEENTALNKNIQTLNGLQKVLNATSEDVEQMLQGYPDLKTIATFATALKRALCESESKKNESRDRLFATKQQLAAEKNAVHELQTRLMQVEDKLVNTERKYKSLKERNEKKRKAPEMDESATETHSPKQPRSSHPQDLNSAILIDNNTSLNSMVNHIEKSDSPYLSLKQSGLSLLALQSRGPIDVPTGILKPSELAMINAARNATKKQQNTSIFYKKQPLQPEPSQKPVSIDLDISYDGMGGHSKLDTFPVPLLKAKSFPKLTAKHKLKRPPSAGNPGQDIGKMLESMIGYSRSKEDDRRKSDKK